MVADAAWLVLVALAVACGRAVHRAVSALGDPARGFAAGADDLAGRLRDAGERVAGAPLVGDEVAAPLTGAADAAASLGAAGAEQAEAAARLALTLGLLTALVPALALTALWLGARLRWRRRAGRALRLARAPGGDELLALRALAVLPAEQLLGAHPDPSAAWRRGDPAAVRALADLHLRSVGVRR
ncbi:hypothetical protein [Kineococcus terrestris]|uniref:hypothetical protein n=1 Tax=Kineococcus terrestris TaxID=2044856 RepID=UPI0034DADBDD